MKEGSAESFMALFVRFMGVLMLLVGMWLGVKVIFEAWSLYRGPHQIERFAGAIERGSNLDKSLASFVKGASKTDVASKKSSASSKKTSDTISLSYFLAWMIVLMLLMLIGWLAMAAIRTGGQLALYDMQMKRFARLLLDDVKRTKKMHR